MWFWVGIAIGALLTLPIGVVAALRESTKQRALRQRARSAKHLAELGTMTAGLAHEIKNPLSTVGLNVQLIQEDLQDLARSIPDAEQIQDQIGRIERRFGTLLRETQRLREILDDFLQFAGRLKLDRSECDVNELIDELVDFFGPQAQAASIQVRTQLLARPGTALVDKNHLKQAVLNLLINASQAMEGARVSTEPSGGNDELILRTERRRILGHEQIKVHITDTGPGIDAACLDKVLEPYYSTKSRGTGLGLPTAKRIIEEHGGTLTVHSEPGRGSDFVITIPVDPTTHDSTEPAR